MILIKENLKTNYLKGINYCRIYYCGFAYKTQKLIPQNNITYTCVNLFITYPQK